MTEEYKEKLIKYITNNLDINEYDATIDNFDIIKGSPLDLDYDNSLWQYIAQLLLRVDRGEIRVNGILPINNSSTKVIYGGYSDLSAQSGSDFSEGFLILIDGNYNGIAMLQQFESGTYIREVQYLAQDENNNIYGVVGDTQYDTEQKYFVMLNNFALPKNNEYNLVLRKSYSLNDSTFRCIDIIKKENEASYLMVGCETINGAEECKGGRGINLKINVGATNEWTRLYTRTSIPYTAYGILGQYNDSGDPVVKVISTTATGGSNTLRININENGTTSTISGDIVPGFKFDIDIFRLRQTKDDNGGLFFQANYSDPDGTLPTSYCLYHLDEYNNLIKADSNSTFETCYSVVANGWTDNFNVKNPLYIKYELNNNAIYVYGYPGNDAIITISSNWKKLVNPYIEAGPYLEFKNYIINLCSVDFNLLSIFTFEGAINHDNPTNYLTVVKRPGLPIKEQDYNEMFVPRYVDVLSDNEIVFSRNIYDSVVFSNTSMDSVQVPYNYLNDIQIQGQNLSGKGNLEFVEDTTQWTKNRYENLDINFINKINVSNRDTKETLTSQAVSLNTTIHNEIDNNGGTATIIYNDESFSTVNVVWQQLSRFTYQAIINITPDKDIIGVDWSDSINGMQFITNFDTPLASGSNHTIKQKITINDEFYTTDLLYNNVQVQYNGENVQVQSKEA